MTDDDDDEDGDDETSTTKTTTTTAERPPAAPRALPAQAHIVRHLKGKVPVDDIVTTLLLTLPRLHKRWGECSLLPDGLPLVKSVNEDMIKATSLIASCCCC